MTAIVFVGVHVIGNPVDILISPEADQAERARIIASMGLDQPLWRQYTYFLYDALHGDLGRSFVFNEPALKLIAQFAGGVTAPQHSWDLVTYRKTVHSRAC